MREVTFGLGAATLLSGAYKLTFSPIMTATLRDGDVMWGWPITVLAAGVALVLVALLGGDKGRK